jgi:uncharacterized protein (UPF0276 family)
LWQWQQRLRRRRWRVRRVRQLSRDRVGLGWRDALAASIYVNLDCIDVLEVILDDCFEAPASQLRALHSLGAEVALLGHGVGLGLASVSAVAPARLENLARVVNALEVQLWSEHLAFVRSGGYEIGHLAAPPRNSATAEGAVANIEAIRRIVGTVPALENIATLIDPPDSCMPEPGWVGDIIAAGGAPLLLDLHNLYANAVNFGHDPFDYLRAFPLHKTQVVHISGGVWIEAESRRLLDDHLHDVPDIIYNMLAWLAEHCPQPLTVILERDGRYPQFNVLLGQLRRAREALAAGRAKCLREAHELATV